MKIDFEKYRDMRICAAVSGGADSMAMLHCLHAHAKEYNITLSVMTCDHGLRGDNSLRDCEFVMQWCSERGLQVSFYSKNCLAEAKNSGVSVETAARNWRRECYADMCKRGWVIATAHHMNDVAETVLFNLARGTALSGVTGIRESAKMCEYPLNNGYSDIKTVRPLLQCSREDIDGYIEKNGIKYVVDATNLSDDYTRNYIRHNVLPQLEKAVSGAVKNIAAFTKAAALDEAYIHSKMLESGILTIQDKACIISTCEEKALFYRAVIASVKDCFHRKDYTSAHLETLYNLQFLDSGKKFEFLSLIAYKENGCIAICETIKLSERSLQFLGIADYELGTAYVGVNLSKPEKEGEFKTLKIDVDKVPDGAELRTRRKGDKFTKFGGGTKSLGDYFTDCKIPLRLRDILPVIAYKDVVLAICGVEISDELKVDESTDTAAYITLKFE